MACASLLQWIVTNVHNRKRVRLVGDLDRHLPFQRREWRVQRLGWWTLVAFVMAALAGLFGNGPLSSAERTTPDAQVRVEYERFIRAGAPHRVVVHLASGPAAQPVEVRLGSDYFESMRVERVLPAPDATAAGHEWTAFRFPAGTTRVVLDCEATDAGRHRLRLAVASAAPVTLWQFAYF